MLNRASSFRAVVLASGVFVAAVLGVGGADAADAERVPVNAQGVAIGEKLASPALSHDGRHLVFQSTDDDLVPGDDNGVADVFVYDYETGELVRASGEFLATFGSGHSLNPAISADGRFVAFASDSNALNLPIDIDQAIDVIDNNLSRDIFVYDREARETKVVSVQTGGVLLDGESDHPSISGDGRFVVFQSRASTPNEPGGMWRIFVHDRTTGEARVISVDETGRSARLDSERPVISADGRYVAFESDAALVAADTNGRRDIYRFDLRESRVELVSVSTAGEAGGASSRRASISADGSMVAFESSAGNLVDGDTNLVPDIFMRDLRTATTSRISVGSDGEQSTGSSTNAVISADGSMVVFESFGQALAPRSGPVKPETAAQGGSRSTVYVRQVVVGRTLMIAEGLPRSTGTRDGDPTISGDGTTMVFAELPIFEEPGGTVGGVEYGVLNRVGSCLNAPDFAVTSIEVGGVSQPVDAVVSVLPGQLVEFCLEAVDTLPCDLETMQIRLLDPTGGDVLPSTMLYVQDDNCDQMPVNPIAPGVLVTADSDVDSLLGITLSWRPSVDDYLLNGAVYQVEFVAEYPGSLQPTSVVVTIQIEPCDLEIDLMPEFFDADPALGFQSGPGGGLSQFDDDGDGDLDFLNPFNLIVNPSNRWEDGGVDADLDTMTLVPSEVATARFIFTVDDEGPTGVTCVDNGITTFDIVSPPTAPYQQDPMACTFGGGSSPRLPCFINIDMVRGVSSSGNIVMIAAPTFPLEIADFEMAPGWVAGDNLVSILLDITVTPSALDAGTNLVSFRLTDRTGHISDPQVNFLVRDCSAEPCCFIDNYLIDGEPIATMTSDELGLPGPPQSCDDVDNLFPAFDGVIDLFPNQTLTFEVNGRMVPEPPFDGQEEHFCFGGSLQIEEQITGGGAFPPEVFFCDVDGPDAPDGTGIPYLCPGDVGSSVAGMQDIRSLISFTPRLQDVGVHEFRYRVIDSSGQSSGECVVTVNVCPPPTCDIYQDEDGDGAPDLDMNMDPIPLGMGTGSVVVVPGQALNFVVSAMADCGEFTVDSKGDLMVGSRKVWLKPTASTCADLALLGCTAPLPGCALPGMGSDDPLVDANMDGDPQDPYGVLLAHQCTIPTVNPPLGKFNLVWDVYDASVAVDADGNPLDPESAKIGQCSVSVTVCPPVTCETTEIMADGSPVDPMFDPEVDTVEVTPGMDNLTFKVTGGGGCEGDLVRFDSFEILCLDEFGMPVDIDSMIDGSIVDRFVFTDINDNPIAFPYDCDGDNMCMIRVKASLGADLYGLCDKIVVRVNVTADPGGPNEQTTSCGVMARVGPCPEGPLCVFSAFSPEICTPDGSPAMYNYPAMGVDGMDPVPTYEIHLEPGSPTIGTAMFTFTADTACFGASFDWSVKGYPIDGDPVNPAMLSVLPSTGNTSIVSSVFTWTPGVNSPSMPPDDLGDHFVTFTVTDNTGVESICQVRIIVCEAPTCIITEDTPLSCESTGDIEVAPGDLVTWTFSTTSTCTPNTELMVDVTGVPAGATHSGIDLPVGFMSPPIGSTFNWVPTPADVGVYEVTYTTKDRCGRIQTCTKIIRVCEPPECVLTVLVNDVPVAYDHNNPSDFVAIKPGETLAMELCGVAGSSECNDLPLTVSLLSAPMGGPALVCNPSLPITGPGSVCTNCTIEPGPLHVSPDKYVYQFGIVDSCGRAPLDVCELRVMVMPCDPPVCEIEDVELDGSPYAPGVDPPILPGQTLTYTVLGTLACGHDDIGLELDCNLPTGAVVTPGPLVVMDKVTTRTWDVEWTPLAGEFCNEPMISFDCTLRVTPPETVDFVTAECNLEVEVGECPAPSCAIGPIMVDSGAGFVEVGSIGSSEGCEAIYAVQPGDIVMFTVTGLPECPDGAQNTLTLIAKQLPPGATVDPPAPVAGALDQAVMATVTWVVTEDHCGDDPMAIFNIEQTCGPNSLDCKVCFVVGVCDEPPTCELTDFMIRPNPDMCFNVAPEEELPFEDLPVEMVPDGYMVSALPGDTIKLTICGDTVCTCTLLTIDADGLPDGVVIECLDPVSGLYEPCDFPYSGGQNETPICAKVQFTVPATSFHITFTVADSDPMTPDAVCVLWVEVETVCVDFEPNDTCELPQTIDYEVCGPYLSGTLEERVTPGCRPDTYLALFDKENLIINSDNNSSLLGDGKASAIYDITAINGLSEGNGSDRWLRIGVTGYPDGLVKPFNGYPQNGPHGQLGEFQMIVTFYDMAGEVISPAIVQDKNGNDTVIDNPFVYTNEFLTGAEAFRVNFQAPRAFQGGGVTASASIEIDNSTGLDSLCDDVDFFKYINLVPFADYCITAVGGLSKDCTPIDLQLGWFDKSCTLMLLDADSGSSGVAMLCVVADINGEIIIGVTGRGDDDFDGYIVPQAFGTDDRAVNGCPEPTTDHGVCGCYTLCITPLNTKTGELIVERTGRGEAMRVVSEAIYRGDMNMDGKTDTSDLGMLIGRFGWKATDGAKPVTDSEQRPGKTAPEQSGSLSGAMED